MLDIKFVRDNKELVKENIRKKFQDEKLPLVDEVVEIYEKILKLRNDRDDLRAERNVKSSLIGQLMKEKKIEEANAAKERVSEIKDKIAELEKEEAELNESLNEKMMVIPQMIDPSVPIGKDDTFNQEIQKYGEPFERDYEIPYHADIIDEYEGLDKESAGRTSGEGFYYLIGDIARLHEATLAYARDFMISKGFVYAIPPFMIHADVVKGVMSFPEMNAMMYKIEGEDLYLIGTSEHSMIGRFKGQLINEEKLPICMTSYSPCFRKEGGSHGLE